MNEIIDALLKDYCTESLQASVSEAIELAEYFEIAYLDDILVDVAMCLDHYELSEINAVVYKKVYQVMIDLLNQHEIQTQEEISLDDILVLVRSLKRLQEHEDSASIVAACDTDENNEDIYANLVQLVDIIPPERTLLSLESVSDALIDNIRRLHDKVNVDSDNELPMDYIQGIKAYHVWVKEVYQLNDDRNWAINLIQQGMQPGLDFKHYWRYAAKVIHLDEERAAWQLMGLLLLGFDSYSSPLLYWRSISEEITEDAGELTQLDQRLTQAFDQFQQWKQQNAHAVAAL